MIVLVTLRLALGWHFFQEGAAKMHGTWSSAGFFGNAKGPFAEFYQGLVWDADGRFRLHLDSTLEAWDRYRARAASHYGFDDRQKAAAGEVLKLHEDQLRWVLDSNADDIAKYFRNLERRAEQKTRGEMREVASLRDQGTMLDAEIKKARGPWLATIDRISASYEKQLNALATPEQKARGSLPLERTGRRGLDTEFLNKIVPYFDLTIGVCLMLGFLTRFAAFAGALFLASVVASQWPGAEGAMPTYYQVVEMLALLLVAATGAGRFAGLDYFVEAARLRLFPPQQATQGKLA